MATYKQETFKGFKYKGLAINTETRVVDDVEIIVSATNRDDADKVMRKKHPSVIIESVESHDVTYECYHDDFVNFIMANGWVKGNRPQK